MGAQKLQKRLQKIKNHLKCWNKNSFGSIIQQKETLLKQIAHLDSKESDFGLTEEDLLLQSQVKGELQYILLKEEISWSRNLTTMAETRG